MKLWAKHHWFSLGRAQLNESLTPQYSMTCTVLTKLHTPAVQGGHLKLLWVIMTYKNSQAVLCQQSYTVDDLLEQVRHWGLHGLSAAGTMLPPEFNLGSRENYSKHCYAAPREFRESHLWISHIPDSHELNIRHRPQRESTFCKWYHSTTCFWN